MIFFFFVGNPIFFSRMCKDADGSCEVVDARVWSCLQRQTYRRERHGELWQNTTRHHQEDIRGLSCSIFVRWNIDNLIILEWKRCLWNEMFSVFDIFCKYLCHILTNCTDNFSQVFRLCIQRLPVLPVIATEIFLVSRRTLTKKLCTPSLTCSVILRVELESRSTWQSKAGNRWINYWSRLWRTTMKWTQLWTLCCSMTLCSMCEWNFCNYFLILKDWFEKYSRHVEWPIRWKI